MVLRLSLPGEGPHGAPKPLPDYGDQLQTAGVPRLIPPEGQVHVRWRDKQIALAGDEVVSLREPTIRITDLGYGALGEGVLTSARVAPALVGVGLLDAVPDEAILTLAARTPVAGIRGRPNYVWDVTAQRLVLGRFGLKANHPNLRQQIAAAFIGDVGLSTSLFPDQNCPGAQQACRDMMFAGKPEITDYRLGAVDAYVRYATVPARRHVDDPEVKRGEQLFVEVRCAVCHVPTRPGRSAAAGAGRPDHPSYTDLLLLWRRAFGPPSRFSGWRSRLAHGAAMYWACLQSSTERQSAARWTRPQRHRSGSLGSGEGRFTRRVPQLRHPTARRCCSFFNRSRAALIDSRRRVAPGAGVLLLSRQALP
jgi:hypothetical protein